MADTTYTPKTYRQQGGDRFVVASGGALDVESGGEIDIESGGALKIAGTAVTATAAELNALDAQVASVTYVVGTESDNVINLSIQLKDAAGADMAAVTALQYYLASDAEGKDVEATTGADAIAIGTDGSLYKSGGDSLIAGLMISEADGDIDIDLTHAGADTFYFCTILPNGKIAVSEAITFDATT